jgi:ankyrin repeat protein
MGSELRNAVIAGKVADVESLCRRLKVGPGGLLDEPEPESSTAEHAFFFDVKGQTALHLAANYGHEAIVKILLEKCAGTTLDHYGRQPAHLAAENGHFECLKLLLAPPTGKRLLMLQRHQAEQGQAREKNGAEVTTSTTAGASPLQTVDPNVRERVCGKTMLHLSAVSGYASQIALLLSLEGIKVNKQEMTGCTALHYACGEGHVDCVEALLAHTDIDVSLKEYIFGQTALQKACGGGHANCVRLLLDQSAAGKDVNVTDEEFGRTALHWAAQNNSPGAVECLRLLLAATPLPADTRRVDVFGRSALIYAAMCGNTVAVQLLLDASALPVGGAAGAADAGSGPDAGAPSIGGADAGAGLETVDVDAEKKAAANHQDREGMTSLLHAAQLNCHDVLRLLLENPLVDRTIANLDGDTIHTIRHRDDTTKAIIAQLCAQPGVW